MDFLKKSFWTVSDALGIHWAPYDIPLERRLQTFAVMIWGAVVLFGEWVAVFLFIKLVYSSLWWLAILYSVWMMSDIDICHRGGRRIEWIRSWTLWRYYRDYFPIKLVKTADLDPSRNYLLACFPHGIICSGAVGTFATNALDFHKMFPGTTCRMITLTTHFLVPLFRDFILAMGLCSSSQESLLYLLDQKKHKGNCVGLVVGGAAEALDSHSGKYNVILNRRKGFIRVAMLSGAPLVPVFSFGEADVYSTFQNSENSLLRRFQDTVRKYTGISPIFPVGRGVFQYSYGSLPFRAPITVVIGRPIEVKKSYDPTEEEVNAVHAEFKQRLIELFETEKVKYLKNHKDAELVFL